jgi:hypothetical protein
MIRDTNIARLRPPYPIFRVRVWVQELDPETRRKRKSGYLDFEKSEQEIVIQKASKIRKCYKNQTKIEEIQKKLQNLT